MSINRVNWARWASCTLLWCGIEERCGSCAVCARPVNEVRRSWRTQNIGGVGWGQISDCCVCSWRIGSIGSCGIGTDWCWGNTAVRCGIIVAWSRAVYTFKSANIEDRIICGALYTMASTVDENWIWGRADNIILSGVWESSYSISNCCRICCIINNNTAFCVYGVSRSSWIVFWQWSLWFTVGVCGFCQGLIIRAVRRLLIRFKRILILILKRFASWSLLWG